MNYTQMLNKVIKDSGLKMSDIVNKCFELGVKFTPNYLSVIKNTDGKIPSDEVSKVIAIACNCENPDILITQAYLDKAPKNILGFLQVTCDNSKSVALSLYQKSLIDNGISDSDYDTKTNLFQKHLDNISLAEFICENIDDTTSLQIQQFTDKLLNNTASAISKTEAAYYIVPAKDIKVISANQFKALGLED